MLVKGKHNYVFNRFIFLIKSINDKYRQIVILLVLDNFTCYGFFFSIRLPFGTLLSTGSIVFILLMLYLIILPYVLGHKIDNHVQLGNAGVLVNYEMTRIQI